MPPLTQEQLEDLRPRLIVIVHRICPDWLRSQADDLVQASLLKLWERSQREGSPAFTSSYLWQAAHSVLVDEIRKHRRRRETGLEDGEASPVSPRTAQPSVRQEGSAVGEAIADCLAQLAAPRRRAVTLYLLGHTVPESSKLLRWSVKRTENLVYRGLADLRQCLRARGVEP